MNAVTNPSVLMVAAENGHLPHGKVGGIGDVIRDVPGYLNKQGCLVQVITPGYGIHTRLSGMKKIQDIDTSFCSTTLTAELYCQIETRTHVKHWVLEHPWITHKSPGQIYYDDKPDSPYATDATRFALFCSFVAELLRQGAFGQLDVVHLHDWHAAPLLLIRHYDTDPLPDHRFVYTIHNLALQGIRPLASDHSSLFSWFPDLLIEKQVLDPRWPDCVNLMRTGITKADKVHLVSPGYAVEVLREDDPTHGIHGGEGLEQDLQTAKASKRLVGILNGCDYPRLVPGRKQSFRNLIELCRQQIRLWMGSERYVASAHLIARDRLDMLAGRSRQVIMTSVGRLTDQKAGLLKLPLADGTPVLHRILDIMGGRGCLFMLGSGDEKLEQFMVETSVRFDNLVFLRGFSDNLPDIFYKTGKLFLMPSLFEPCGISQMLAMRSGQPCVVNLVGGLKDTIQDGVNGYGYSADNLTDLAQSSVDCFAGAFDHARRNTPAYNTICEKAALSRFPWDHAASRYIEELYNDG